jgi:hypothetical protein
MTRTAQGKPIWGMSFSRAMGYITAPTEEPDATIPKARARRRLNHVDTQATAGMNKLYVSYATVRTLHPDGDPRSNALSSGRLELDI